MPGKVKVRIISGRNLPVMDRSSDTTDAFAEVRLGLTTFKTDVIRKSLNPVWNSEWFRFDVDDLELQDEPLTIRIMDYDTYSANDAIGKVYIDLNPLLWPTSPTPSKKESFETSSNVETKPTGGMMCGWLPIFDTMNGVRGEVNVQVKVELFSDLNRFRQSSCGVQFFRTSGIPEGYRVQFINGFVEELVMNDDPEYQWIDKIRTPRASNEARQTLFLKLSGTIQRKIGLKALELGGNAVLGYQQKFDLESDNIVVRGIGTAVTLTTFKEVTHKDGAFSNDNHRWSHKTFHEIFNGISKIDFEEDFEGSSRESTTVSIDKCLKVKPWYRKTSFREAAQTIRYVSTGSYFQRNNTKPDTTPGNGALQHQRVSSLRSMLPPSTPNKNSTTILLSKNSQGTLSPQSSPLISPKSSKQNLMELYSKEVRAYSGARNQSEVSIQNIKEGNLNKASYQDNKSELNSSNSDILNDKIITHLSTEMLQPLGDQPLFDFGSEDDMFLVEDSDSDLEKFTMNKSLKPPLDEAVTSHDDQEMNVCLDTSMLSAELSVKIQESKSHQILGPVTLIVPPNLDNPSSSFQSQPLSANIKCATCINMVGMSKAFESCVKTNNLADNKRLTVPSVVVMGKLASGRNACQRSQSTSGAVCRPTLNRAERDVCSGRCISLSPANSFRDRFLTSRLSVAFNKNEITNKPSASSNNLFGFPARSVGNDVLSKLDGVDLHSRMGPEAIERPSPDHDMGSSPRGFGLVHAPSEKQFGIHKYSNRVGLTQESLELLEYPFITLQRFPKGFIHRFGGFVCCRSVKLLEGLQEDEGIRDIWWQDTRREVRSHARSLGCNIIVGYTEDTVICDDIIILCASGTAVVGNLSFMLDLESYGAYGPPFKTNFSGNVTRTKSEAYYNSAGSDLGISPPLNSSVDGSDSTASVSKSNCCLVHIPYADISLPYAFRVIKCRSCQKGPVPDVLFCTVEPPPTLEIIGRGCLMQATVLKLKKDLKGENNAREISDALPFVEYEIHRQLLNKLRVKGMNALFGLKINIALNDRTIVAVATATGFFVAALPSPRPPKLQQSRGGDEQYLQRMQVRLDGKFLENLNYYGIERSPKVSTDSTNGNTNVEQVDDGEIDLDTDGHEADLTSGNKETCILEIDDSEDVDILDSLMEVYPPPWIQVMSTEEIVGISPGHIVKCCQTFSQLVSQKVNPTSRELSTACRKLLSALYFKLRRMKPCILCSIDFRAELNEDNELHISIYGSVIGLAHDGKTRDELAKELESLDIDDAANSSSPERMEPRTPVKLIPKTSIRKYFYSDVKDDKFIINLTPLSYVPGAKIDKYLGSLNFFLIRETSSLREVGGISSFVQSFVCEIYSIVRSHVSALGGNALVSFFISDLCVLPSVHKNQAQCLVHAGGDAVQISFIPPTEPGETI